jgi:hypothetical protein
MVCFDLILSIAKQIAKTYPGDEFECVNVLYIPSILTYWQEFVCSVRLSVLDWTLWFIFVLLYTCIIMSNSGDSLIYTFLVCPAKWTQFELFKRVFRHTLASLLNQIWQSAKICRAKGNFLNSYFGRLHVFSSIHILVAYHHRWVHCPRRNV